MVCGILKGCLGAVRVGGPLELCVGAVSALVHVCEGFLASVCHCDCVLAAVTRLCAEVWVLSLVCCVCLSGCRTFEDVHLWTGIVSGLGGVSACVWLAALSSLGSYGCVCDRRFPTRLCSGCGMGQSSVLTEPCGLR